MGAPVASGAKSCTAATKRCSVSLSLASPRGNTSMRARPSGATQSRTSSSGSVSRVTGPACSAARICPSVATSGAMSATCARSRSSRVPRASFDNTRASRAASLAAMPAAGVATPSNTFAARVIACTVSSSLGGGFTSLGLKIGSSSSAASASKASFSCCCSGTKLASVTT